MKLKKIIFIALTFVVSGMLIACTSQTNNTSKELESGTYIYEKEGMDGSEMGFEDEVLTLHYELRVADDKNIFNIQILSEEGNNIQYLYSEKVIIDTAEHIIKDSKGTKLEYTLSNDSITLPDLAGNMGDTVTLTK